MRTIPTLALAATIGLSACAQPAMEVDTGDIEVMSWRASIARSATADSLAAPAGLVGSLVVRPGADLSTTSATLMLSNAVPNSTHPWHIHTGTCENTGGIVGPATAYTPIQIGADGRGEATVTLPFSTPTTGEYSVNVHKSPTELGTIIACGPLTMGASSMR
jgi:hypothetical protein